MIHQPSRPLLVCSINELPANVFKQSTRDPTLIASLR